MVEGKNVDKKVSVPFHKEDDTLHKTGSSVHGKFLYNNDCHKKEGSHTNFHRKIGFSLSRPSFSLLQCAGQDMASKQVQGKEGMGILVYFHSDDLVSFSLASV